jgi:hypothetical protein
MGNCGNFLELAQAECGADVGFGKAILVYGSRQDVSLTEMTATAINTAIESGDIIGVIQGWHTIAGAPVAEISVERTGTAEMKLIRPEILADTLTFESNISNRAVIASLVAAGTLQCLLIDDLGSVFGKKSTAADLISTMPLNFSSKVSSAFQSDNATEKTVAVTARYLVADEDVAMLFAEVETEDIVVKTQVDGFLHVVSGLTAISAQFSCKLIDKRTQKPYETAILAAEVTARNSAGAVTVAEVVSSDNVLELELTGTGFSTASEDFYVTISGAECFMKETKFTVVAP